MRVLTWLACSMMVAGLPAPVLAHYHILLPGQPSAERGQPVSFTYRFGHPFEHQMFAAEKPQSLVIVTPDGQVHDQTTKLERYEVAGSDGKPVAAYRFSFTPTQRGDHVVVARGAPIWMPEDKEFLQDTVKVVLHVQTQNGWDTTAGGRLDLVPLTRPYGLRPGMVFQAQALGPTTNRLGGPTSSPRVERVGLARLLVEVERFNPSPPQELPPEEHITRTVKTDPNGVATVSLPEPGWWAMTAVREGGTQQRDGKGYPLKLRCTHWVYVDAPTPHVPAK